MQQAGSIYAKLGLKSTIPQDTKKAKSHLGGLNSTIKKVGIGIAGYLSTRALTKGVSNATKAWDMQAKSAQSLLTALKGNSAIQERLMSQAASLQGKTLFGDEKTIQAQARLASILGEDEEAIRKLTPLVQDLATSKKMDLSAAAELVAKSVGSSTNALSRYGIQIEGAVGSSERLDSAVNALSKQVGGQAVAAAKVGRGEFEQLSNTLGDIQEQIGNRLLSSSKNFTPELKRMASAFQDIVNVKPSKELSKTRIEMNAKFKVLKSLNPESDQYKTLLNEINEAGKDYLPTLLDTSMTYEEMAANVRRANLAMLDNIKTMAAQESMQRATNKVTRIYGRIIELNIKAEEAIQKGRISQAQYFLKAIDSETEKLGKASEKLAEVQNWVSKNIDNSAKVATSASNEVVKSFDEQAEAAGRVIEKIEKLQTIQAKGVVSKNSGEDMMNLQPVKEAVVDLEEYMLELGNAGTFMSETLSSSLETAFASLGETGKINVGAIFGNIQSKIGEFAVNVGKALIAYGMAMDAFKKAFTNPYIAIAIGGILVGIGSYIKGAASKGPAGGGGGGGYNSSSYGTGMGAGSGTGTNITVQLETILQGENLRLAVARAEESHRGIT